MTIFKRTAISDPLDAFGKLRISNGTTLFDSKQIFDNQPLFWDDQEVSGSGTSSTTSAGSAGKAKTQLAVSNATAGKRVRQTFMRFNYQPGKSQLIVMTGVLGAPASGITQEIGQFDDDNGILFRCKDAVLKAVIRSSTSGSAVDNEVTQANWNLDTMDGNGASGVNLDLTKDQIFFFDYEWLGVGDVAMGFFVNRKPIYCHVFNHANVIDEVYMSTPNLPLRYSIENDGTGVASAMDHICSTVISEGGSQDLGVVRCTSTAGTSMTATTENTLYALLGIRLKSTHIGATVKMISASTQIQTATDKVEWSLLFNPTVAGTFTYNDLSNSAIQAAVGVTANTVTGGTPIAAGFIESGGNQSGAAGSSDSQLENALRLGSAIDGTLDQLVLCGRPVGGSTNVELESSLAWREGI